ncbi:MAG: J domain-containing protein [Acidimicrobiales bacterium]|nr:J domain-containing protein [Acidimicrobiales bacterium]
MDGETARAALGLPALATLDLDMITSAYRRRAKECHPDAGGDGRAFARLAEAVRTLRAELTELTARSRRRAHNPFQVVVCQPTPTWERFDGDGRTRRSARRPVEFADVLARAMAS